MAIRRAVPSVVFVSLLTASTWAVAKPTSRPARPAASAPHRPSARPSPRAKRAPKQRKSKAIDLKRFEPNEQMRQLGRRHDPKASAFALSLLRSFAEGRRSRANASVARAMKKAGIERATAKRILADIDALPPSVRAKSFGSSSPSMISAQKVEVVPGVALGGIGVRPDTLPAESVPPPSKFEFRLTGYKATATDDGDGSDEVVALATLLYEDAGAYKAQTSSIPTGAGTESVAVGNAHALDELLFEGAGAGLVVSGVFEVDGDPGTIREDWDAMIALAQGMADQLQGSDPAAKLAFAVDYTFGLLALANPDRWPQGVVQKTMLSGQDTSLLALYSSPESSIDGVPWKLAHEHTYGSGAYALYFSVPSIPVEMPLVIVKILGLTSVSKVDDGADQDDLSLEVSIKNASKLKKLAENKDSHVLGWSVSRQIKPGNFTVEIDATEFTEGRDRGTVITGWNSASYCGDWGNRQYPPCPDEMRLDLDPDETKTQGDVFTPGKPYATGLKFMVDTKTGTIHEYEYQGLGDPVGDVGETITLTGDTWPKGRIKFVITVKP